MFFFLNFYCDSLLGNFMKAFGLGHLFTKFFFTNNNYHCKKFLLNDNKMYEQQLQNPPAIPTFRFIKVIFKQLAISFFLSHIPINNYMMSY